VGRTFCFATNLSVQGWTKKVLCADIPPSKLVPCSCYLLSPLNPRISCHS